MADVLRIPIEIKTEESKEIKEIIDKLSKQKTLPKGNKNDSSSKSAFTNPADDRGGIFAQSRGNTAFIRDKKSRTPYQRENEFSKLREQVSTMESKQLSMMNRVNTGVGKGAGMFGKASSLMGGGIGGAMGMAKGLAKSILPIGIAITIIETVTTIVPAILKQLQAVGGPWDIRFRRNIETEVASSISRREKANISAGATKIRMTSFAGFRGAASSANANAYISGNPIYSQDMETRGKGLN